jgi:hypothetical protein
MTDNTSSTGGTDETVQVAVNGGVPSRAQVLEAVDALFAQGRERVTPGDALEWISPGHRANVRALDARDNVYPSIHNTFVEAGNNGALKTETGANDAEIWALNPHIEA